MYLCQKAQRRRTASRCSCSACSCPQYITACLPVVMPDRVAFPCRVMALVIVLAAVEPRSDRAYGHRARAQGRVAVRLDGAGGEGAVIAGALSGPERVSVPLVVLVMAPPETALEMSQVAGQRAVWSHR